MVRVGSADTERQGRAALRDRFMDLVEPFVGDWSWVVIPDQPVLSAIGGILAAGVAALWAHRSGLVWWKSLITSGAAALIGAGLARVFWVLTVFDRFLDEPTLLIDPYQGGQTSFGALTGAAIGAAIALKLFKAPILKHADTLAPSGLLGIAFARVGCLMRSCDYGIPSDLPWAVRYPTRSPVFRRHLDMDLVSPGDLLSAPVHPFPLYLAAWTASCFLVALVFPNLFGSKPGQRAVGVGLLYLAGRFCWEFLRHPGNAPMVLGPLNAGHAFALASFVVLLVIYALVSKHDPVTTPQSP